MTKLKSKVFIIAGPSGVGKNTIISKLLDYFSNAVIIPTYTTREKRLDDDSKTRVTITDAEFFSMIEDDHFVEFKKVHQWHYGKRKKDFQEAFSNDKHVIIDIDVQGLEDYRKQFPELCAVFIEYEDIKHLEKRLRKNRPDVTDDDIKIRLESAIMEMSHKHKYDHVIKSYEGDIQKTFNEIVNVINKKINED